MFSLSALLYFAKSSTPFKRFLAHTPNVDSDARIPGSYAKRHVRRTHMQKYQRLHAHDDVQWAVDRGSNACAWVTCVEKGGQACITSTVDLCLTADCRKAISNPMIGDDRLKIRSDLMICRIDGSGYNTSMYTSKPP